MVIGKSLMRLEIWGASGSLRKSGDVTIVHDCAGFGGVCAGLGCYLTGRDEGRCGRIHFTVLFESAQGGT